MFHVFNDPWMYFWVGLLVVLRNIGGAFPEPDTALKSGFGSGSPGYKFVYNIARGMTMDLKTIGIDSKAMGLKLKSGPESQTVIETKE